MSLIYLFFFITFLIADILYQRNIKTISTMYYAFLSYLIDFDELWYKNRLDLEEENRLHFVMKKRKVSIGILDKTRTSNCSIFAHCPHT